MAAQPLPLYFASIARPLGQVRFFEEVLAPVKNPACYGNTLKAYISKYLKGSMKGPSFWRWFALEELDPYRQPQAFAAALLAHLRQQQDKALMQQLCRQDLVEMLLVQLSRAPEVAAGQAAAARKAAQEKDWPLFLQQLILYCIAVNHLITAEEFAAIKQAGAMLNAALPTRSLAEEKQELWRKSAAYHRTLAEQLKLPCDKPAFVEYSCGEQQSMGIGSLLAALPFTAADVVHIIDDPQAQTQENILLSCITQAQLMQRQNAELPQEPPLFYLDVSRGRQPLLQRLQRIVGGLGVEEREFLPRLQQLCAWGKAPGQPAATLIISDARRDLPALAAKLEREKLLEEVEKLQQQAPQLRVVLVLKKAGERLPNYLVRVRAHGGWLVHGGYASYTERVAQRMLLPYLEQQLGGRHKLHGLNMRQKYLLVTQFFTTEFFECFMQDHRAYDSYRQKSGFAALEKELDELYFAEDDDPRMAEAARAFFSGGSYVRGRGLGRYLQKCMYRAEQLIDGILLPVQEKERLQRQMEQLLALTQHRFPLPGSLCLFPPGLEELAQIIHHQYVQQDWRISGELLLQQLLGWVADERPEALAAELLARLAGGNLLIVTDLGGCLRGRTATAQLLARCFGELAQQGVALLATGITEPEAAELLQALPQHITPLILDEA